MATQDESASRTPLLLSAGQETGYDRLGWRGLLPMLLPLVKGESAVVEYVFAVLVVVVTVG